MLESDVALANTTRHLVGNWMPSLYNDM